MAFLFFRHHSANKFRQLLVASAAAHLAMQIVVPHREQAGADLSVAGDAYSATLSAERMRDGRDDADLADAVVEAVAAGGVRRPAGGLHDPRRNGQPRPGFPGRDNAHGGAHPGPLDSADSTERNGAHLPV